MSTVLIILAFGLLLIAVMNGMAEIKDGMQEIKERQDTLYTTVLGKLNATANTNTKTLKMVDKMTQTYFDCAKDQIVILRHIAEILDDKESNETDQEGEKE